MDYQSVARWAMTACLSPNAKIAGQANEKASANDNVIVIPFSSLTVLPGRLYLASYTSPPTAETLFPYPDALDGSRPAKQRSSPSKPRAPAKTRNAIQPCYFTIDKALLYNPFFLDFGPLHIGHLYRFAVHFNQPVDENDRRPILFWSMADPKSEYREHRRPPSLTVLSRPC